MMNVHAGSAMVTASYTPLSEISLPGTKGSRANPTHVVPTPPPMRPNPTLVASPDSEHSVVSTSAENVTVFHRMGSALVGSLVTAVLLTPLDVARVRMQVAHAGISLESCKMYNGLMEVFSTDCIKAHRSCPCHTASLLSSTRTVSTALRVLLQYEGLTSLWRGLAPSLALAVPTTVLYFSAYDELRVHLCSLFSASIATCVSAATARGIATALCTPLEIIRTQSQARTIVDPAQPSAWYRQFAVQYRKAGLGSLWRGLGVTLWRDLPFSMIYWSGYEFGKTSLTPSASTSTPLWASFVAGACSGMIAATLTHPFDVAKTRIQTVHLRTICCESGHSPVCQGKVFASLHMIYEQNGLRGLTAGLQPRIVKIAPSCAIMISCYEFGKSFLSKLCAH
jgi:solute carrier family 25 protein 39/40